MVIARFQPTNFLPPFLVSLFVDLGAIQINALKKYFAEEGLKSALTCTDTLYNMNTQKLSNLTKREIKDMFKGAPTSEFYLEPGMTALEVAMKAGCFKNEGRLLPVVVMMMMMVVEMVMMMMMVTMVVMMMMAMVVMMTVMT